MSRASTRLGPIATAVIVGLQVAWLGWFLLEPLPNAKNVGGTVRRGILLLRAIPEVVPGVHWPQSMLGMAADELSHVENLPQRLPIALGAAYIAASAITLGHLTLRAIGLLTSLEHYERPPLAFGLGAALLGSITLLIGRVGGLTPWSVRVGLAIPILVEIAFRLLRRNTESRPAERAFDRRELLFAALIVAPFVLVAALGSMNPTNEFDSLEYHLQGPKEAYLAGRIAFLPHNVYTSMPAGVEMLHLLGMHLTDDWWRGALVGTAVIMLHGVMAAWFVALIGRRLGSSRAGLIAAVVYLSTPWVYRIAIIPWVEGPLCFYHAALVWAACYALGAGTPGRRPAGRTLLAAWFAIGLLAGGAMACKYTALISAVIPFGVLALMQRSWRIVALYVLGWAIVMGPWLAKNVVDTGNPVHPLGYSVFKNDRRWSPELETKWNKVHGPRPIAWQPLVDGVVEVAGRSDWQSPLFTALAPLALLRRPSRRAALVLFGYVVYIFATWWLLTHRLDRFWLPLLPPLAVLAGLGADWTRSRWWAAATASVIGLSLLTNFTYVSTALAGLNQWTDSYDDLRFEVPRMADRHLARLDDDLQPGAKVLLVGQASVFPMRHAIVYNTVFDPETIETIARGRHPDAIAAELDRRGITHVYVDWHQIRRLRSPGNYGFTDFVTPELFADLVRSGVLEEPTSSPFDWDLYKVR